MGEGESKWEKKKIQQKNGKKLDRKVKPRQKKKQGGEMDENEVRSEKG